MSISMKSEINLIIDNQNINNIKITNRPWQYIKSRKGFRAGPLRTGRIRTGGPGFETFPR